MSAAFMAVASQTSGDVGTDDARDVSGPMARGSQSRSRVSAVIREQMGDAAHLLCGLRRRHVLEVRPDGWWFAWPPDALPPGHVVVPLRTPPSVPPGVPVFAPRFPCALIGVAC